VSYSVTYLIDPADLGPDVRQEVEQAFHQIADAVASIPETSPFFASLKESILQIDVARWRIGYRVERRSRKIVVIEATRLPR
jgi:hypothetical protein